MPAKLAIFCLHGMGETEEDYWTGLYEQLEHRLGPDIWNDIHFKRVFFQDIFQ